MTIDDFTDNCIARARGDNSEGVEPSVSFSFVPFLIPLIQTAIEFLMEKLGNCGKNDDEVVEAINEKTFMARFVMNQSVAMAERQCETSRGAGTYVKKLILNEAGATDDEDLVSMLHEPDDYFSDATDVWGG